MKLTSSQLQELILEYSSILPEGAKERIVIDEKGGLAYPLFGSYFSNLMIPADVSRSKLNSLEMYFNAIRNYIDDAGQYAWDCGFDLVYIRETSGGKRVSSHFVHNKIPMHRMGVGKKPVTSAERVEDFCKMIKSGHDKFEDRYKNIRDLAERLR